MYKLQAHNIVIHNFQRSSTYSVKYWLYPPLYNIAVAYFILNNSYLFISYRYIVRSLQSPHWQQFVYSPHLWVCFFLVIVTGLFLFWAVPQGMCGILVPWPGIKSMAPAVEARSLNHWIPREVLLYCLDSTHKWYHISFHVHDLFLREKIGNGDYFRNDTNVKINSKISDKVTIVAFNEIEENDWNKWKHREAQQRNKLKKNQMESLELEGKKGSQQNKTNLTIQCLK